ncbi:MAG: MFS transporter [Betaproteobacteria bacterium]|nr:MFS transporter [Betaproteobacteria bacterium]
MSAIAPAAPVVAGLKSFRDVWLVSIGHGLTHWYPATFYVLLPLIGRELGLSYSQIGLIMTVQALVGALSNIPGGLIVDTFGRKNLMLALSLFWVAFPYALMGFTQNYAMLLICVSLVGIGNNLWHPAAIPMLADRFPHRKGLVLSLHSMGGNAGDALAPLAVGALLATLTWREVVVLNIAPGMIIACLLLAMLGNAGRVAAAASKPAAGKTGGSKSGARGNAEGQSMAQYLRGMRELLKSRGLAMLVLGTTFRAMTQAALLVFLPLFLAYEMGYEPFQVGVCLFALQAAGFIAAPIAGQMSDKLGPRGVIMWSMMMTAAVLIMMIVAGPSPAFVYFIAVLGFFLYAVRSVLQAWLLELTPKNMGGSSIGIMFGAQSLGAAISPAVGGWLADSYGLMATFMFLAATIVVANFFVFFVPSPPAHSVAR